MAEETSAMSSSAGPSIHQSSSTLTDDQIDLILHEAEQRLAPNEPASAPGRKQAASLATEKTKRIFDEPNESALSVRSIKRKRPATEDTAGNDWFNLPKTDLTTEMKRDWQILRMRNVLDPKQQKKALRAEPPKYSQVGEIISGPADFYSGRISRKERKRNLLQEALNERDETKFRHKYASIQDDKTSGKKAFYKNLISKRTKNKR